MKKKKGFFEEQYSLCWKFFNESRWYIVFALGLFALTFLIGFAYPQFFRAEIFSFIEELMAMFEGKGAMEMIGLIFFNNVKASFFAMILGIGIGIFPLVTLVVNGYLLGFVSREAASIGGLGVLWQLAPHGIFELPAIIFSIGIGILLGKFLISGKNKIRGVLASIVFIIATSISIPLFFLIFGLFYLVVTYSIPVIFSPIVIISSAFIPSAIVGLYIGYLTLPKEDKKIAAAYLKHNSKEGLRFFAFVVFPLLVIAAIIEGALIGLLG